MGNIKENENFYSNKGNEVSKMKLWALRVIEFTIAKHDSNNIQREKKAHDYYINLSQWSRN